MKKVDDVGRLRVPERPGEGEAPMLHLTQLSSHPTLEGSFSAVSTATIARKDAFAACFEIYKIPTPLHLWNAKLEDSFAPLKRQKFSKFSSRVLYSFLFPRARALRDRLGENIRKHQHSFIHKAI